MYDQSLWQLVTLVDVWRELPRRPRRSAITPAKPVAVSQSRWGSGDGAVWVPVGYLPAHLDERRLVAE